MENMVNSQLEIYRNKKIVVTGHTGFKGSWLCMVLLKLGAEVHGYSLEPKTPHDNFSSTNLEKQLHHTIGNILDRKKLNDFIQKVNPDFVFHLAAQAIVLDSYTNPVETFETNIMGSVHVFEAVRKCGNTQGIINVTSDKCYQNKEWVWGYRENDAMGGNDPYSASKGAAELVAHAYNTSFFKDTDCTLASVRAGNVIGGGDWAAFRIVPDFFRAFINKAALEIRNPDATRPWQFVLEPLTGYLLLGAALLGKEPKKFDGGWNFGPLNATHKTVMTLLNEIKKESSLETIEVKHVSNAMHEAQYLQLDITKATTQLNWNPKLNFEETVKFTVDGYFDEIQFSSSALLQKRMSMIDLYLTK